MPPEGAEPCAARVPDHRAVAVGHDRALKGAARVVEAEAVDLLQHGGAVREQGVADRERSVHRPLPHAPTTQGELRLAGRAEGLSLHVPGADHRREQLARLLGLHRGGLHRLRRVLFGGAVGRRHEDQRGAGTEGEQDRSDGSGELHGASVTDARVTSGCA